MLADAPPRDFYAPDRYSWYWPWIGALLVAGVLVWYGWVWWSTRTRATRVSTGPEPDRLTRLKQDALRQVDAVVDRAEDGAITHREAHQRISGILRVFVHSVSGVAAPSMTLTELRAAGQSSLQPVAEVVGTLYPPEFGVLESDSVTEAAEAARGVIRGWS